LGLLEVSAAALLASTSPCPPAIIAPAQPTPVAQTVTPATDAPAIPISDPTPSAPSPRQDASPQDAVSPAAASPAPDSADGAAQSGEVPATPAADDANPDEEVILVTARPGAPPGDPAAAINEITFTAVQAVDDVLIAPVAHGYEAVVPKPLRDGVHNVLNNLDEPIVFVNFLLQLKIGKAFETAGRFLVNSTLGVGGLFDIAKRKPFNLPRRSNGLADTLGFYGVGPGPYIFLPLIGSTSVRDVFGRVLDLSILPTAVPNPFAIPVVTLSKATISAIDDRVENDEVLTWVKTSSNPYAAMREFYLKKRAAEIDVLKGKRANAEFTVQEFEALKTTELPPAKVKDKDKQRVKDQTAQVPLCPAP
jgi:phospholipid-binding lipoprotein MlaA